jgi:hypothetical protein
VNEDELRRYIGERVVRDYGTAYAAAIKVGVPSGTLYRQLRGDLPFGPKTLAAFGVRKVVRYEPVETQEEDTER